MNMMEVASSLMLSKLFLLLSERDLVLICMTVGQMDGEGSLMERLRLGGRVPGRF